MVFDVPFLDSTEVNGRPGKFGGAWSRNETPA
jgi:hypothetical protein